MKYTLISRGKVLDTLCNDFKAVIEQFAAERGLAIEKLHYTYDANSLRPSLVLKTMVAADGRPTAQVEFERYCGLYQTPPTAYGASVTVRLKGQKIQGTLVGFALNRPKFPVRVDIGGKVYLFTETVLKQVKVDKPMQTA